MENKENKRTNYDIKNDNNERKSTGLDAFCSLNEQKKYLDAKIAVHISLGKQLRTCAQSDNLLATNSQTI